LDGAKREEMGRLGKEWMRKDFSWESAAERLIKAYRDLVE
jgi:glycosyltransferase involved in cell wall biosynthesis